MNGLKGGQGRDEHDLTETAVGMWVLLMWMAAAVLMAIAIAEVL